METENLEKSEHPKAPKDVKTSRHVSRYLIIGIILTVLNYGIYTILSNLIIKNNSFLWLSTLISTTVTTFAAYLLHSKVTWKERPIAKSAKYKFFVWNLVGAFIIGPLLTQIFSLITPLYNFVYHILEFMHIPFTYEFTLTTGVFIITSTVSMIINFLFYDKFVFGKKKSKGEKE